ncbi:MAG: GAF domain-containing protein [Proteobacteria bacterium]|nr:GAF domain-containing protein [Pseudomonadota bacterium]
MQDKTDQSLDTPIASRYPLMMMSLFDGEFSVDWVQELSGLKATQILNVTEEGVFNGWLSKTGPGVYVFSDKRKRNELAKSVPIKDREQWHRAIADTIGRDILDEDRAAQATAHHRLHFTNDEKGCRQLMKAGNQYRKTHHHQEALQCYQKIISDLGNTEGKEAYRIFTHTVIAYSKIVEMAPDIQSIIPPLKAAIAKAKKRSDDVQTVLLEMHLAKNEWYCTNFNTAFRHFNQGWSLAQKIDDPKLKHSAGYLITFFLYGQGQYRELVGLNEEGVPDIERLPQSGFPLLSAQLLGISYAYIGQVALGMGMLDAIYSHCQNIGDYVAGSYTGYHIGSLLIELGRYDEAIRCLENALQQSHKASNFISTLLINLQLALAYYQKREIETSMRYLDDFLDSSKGAGFKMKGNYTTQQYLVLLWAMEIGDYPKATKDTVQEVVRRTQSSENGYQRGIAYRYRAMLAEKNGASSDRVIRDLQLSEKWLEKAGHRIQLARTRMVLSSKYLSMGKGDKAGTTLRKSMELLDGFLFDQVPDDLQFLLKDMRTDKSLLKEIMKLGQELVSIHNDQYLVREILRSVNRITGAERGAIFLVDDTEVESEVALRAARNLTVDDMSNPRFASSMKMIRQAAATGESQNRIQKIPQDSDPLQHETIRSCYCVPMKLREKVVGVLYVDNRFFPSAFKESDIEFLSYFAAQTAVALDIARIHEQNRASIQRLEDEKHYFESQQRESHQTEEFIGASRTINEVLANVERVAKTDSTVLILGETGVGKELIARAIHLGSERHDIAFVKVNCSTFPETLIASELFGHEKGAFTGAVERRMGRFELADGGTLFLDEIGDIPMDVQVRLLRILQSKEFERVGGRETIRSDFRLLAATNRDLREEVRKGRFREDLFYRLNVFPIQIPPLRERKDDIPLLTEYFLGRFAEKQGKPVEKISDGDMRKLMGYSWPGNVRELENVVERGTILSSKGRFHLPELDPGRTTTSEDREMATLKENERRHILWALEKTGGKIRGPGGAAQLLDIHHNTLYSRMKKLGIQKSNLKTNFKVNVTSNT